MNKMTTRNKVFFADNTWQHEVKMVDYKSFSIIYTLKGGFDTEEEASDSYNKCYEKFKDDITRLKRATDIKYTFMEYMNHWFQDIFLTYSGSSTTAFAWTIYKIIYPSIKRDVLLNRVTGSFMNEILDSCKDLCYSAAPMAKKVISIALKEAAIEGYVKENIMEGVNPYPWRMPKITILNQAQLKALLGEASRYRTVYLEILLALFCGLRKGEIRGLKYSDFDREAKTIRVSRQYCRENEVFVHEDSYYTLGNIEHYIKPPKTHNSYRTLRVPDVIFKELEVRRKANEKILEHHPEMLEASKEYVSLGPHGNIMSDSTISSALERIRIRAGITEHITVHGLRHMFCSILIEQNVPLEDISKMMGHARENTTFDLYCGIMDANDKITQVVSDYLDPVSYYREIS